MDDHLHNENISTLVTISAFLSFPYIWLGLFLLLSLMYGGNFFGTEWSGSLVAGLLCLGLLNPVVPGMVSNFIVRPLLLNLLGREIISSAGCLIGLGGFLLTGLGTLYFLSRDLTTAAVIFLAAPAVGSILAIATRVWERNSTPRSRKSSRPSIEVRRPPSRSLPSSSRERSRSLADRSNQPRLSLPRSSDRKTEGRRRPPPPRRRG